MIYFIGEINKIQNILNRSVIPNNIGYVVSRYFIFIVIGITVFITLKKERNIGKLFYDIIAYKKSGGKNEKNKKRDI